MTWYLSFRSATVGGSAAGPRLLQGDGANNASALTARPVSAFQQELAGRDVLFACHGFNVNYTKGLRSLGRLETALAPRASELFVGILWPGDAWLPVVNYPFEGNDADRCGSLLAEFCDRHLENAASLSFVSHSLGARVILAAVGQMRIPVRSVCVTAAAVDCDALTNEFADAAARAERVSALCSKGDRVLQLAFRIGDPLADLLGNGPVNARAALGYSGPLALTAHDVRPPWQIPLQPDAYGHGDYLPSGAPSLPPAQNRWRNVAAFIARAFRGDAQAWPG